MLISRMSTLRSLVAHRNRYSYAHSDSTSVSADLTRSRFQGTIPALDRLHDVEHLTLFGNMFGGTLRLPTSARFSILLAQANRLSCEISESNVTIEDLQHSLVLPGIPTGQHPFG